MAGRITGIFNILATPFHANFSVDYDSLRKLVRFQMEIGAHGLTILGVLGEAAKLSVDERKAVMDTVVETVAGAIPIVVGTSHSLLETCIELSAAAFAAGRRWRDDRATAAGRQIRSGHPGALQPHRRQHRRRHRGARLPPGQRRHSCRPR